MNYILAFFMVFSIVYIIIPYLRNISYKFNFVDRPTERKKHSSPTPLLGGIGIFLGFSAGYISFVRPVNSQFFCVLISSLMVLSIGLVDDYFKTKGREFPIYPRLLVHISAAIMVFESGIMFKGFTNPFSKVYITLPFWLQFTLTIVWIFGVTTVINWSDGMDGLAGSLVAIAGTTLFLVALAKGQEDSAMMAAVLVGSTIGFLRYNSHPASIFMGDSGANFLGFILSIIALSGAFKGATIASVFIPILTLGVPIFDNIFVVLKRFIDGKPIYQADRGQIHYRLLSKGLSLKQTVYYICFLSIGLSFVSMMLLLIK